MLCSLLPIFRICSAACYVVSLACCHTYVPVEDTFCPTVPTTLEGEKDNLWVWSTRRSYGDVVGCTGVYCRGLFIHAKGNTRTKGRHWVSRRDRDCCPSLQYFVFVVLAPLQSSLWTTHRKDGSKGVLQTTWLQGAISSKHILAQGPPWYFARVAKDPDSHSSILSRRILQCKGSAEIQEQQYAVHRLISATFRTAETLLSIRFWYAFSLLKPG